ncbi:MAG: hypothetical protein ACO23N_04955, partial [Opitutales bacterium]
MRPQPSRRPIRPIPRPQKDSGFWGGPGYWLLLVAVLCGGGILAYDRFIRAEGGSSGPTAVVDVEAPDKTRKVVEIPTVPEEKVTGSVLGEDNKTRIDPESIAKVRDRVPEDLPPPPPKFTNEDVDALTLRKYKTVSTRLTTARLGTKASKEDTAAHSIHATPDEPLRINTGDSGKTEWYRATVGAYWASIDPDRCVPHPDANAFPGKVADGADRVITAVNLVVNIPRWRSTGLYAAPGERITFRIDTEDAKLGLVA